MTKKQTEYVQHRIAGESQRSAARKSGYSESTAVQASRTIERSLAVQQAFKKILYEAGATDEKLAKRLAEGLDAMETKFFQKEGVVTDQRDVINWSERRQYCELIARIKQVIPPPEKPVEDFHQRPIQLNVVYIDANGQPVDGPYGKSKRIELSVPEEPPKD